MLTGHLYIFFEEMSIQDLCVFLSWVVFLLMSCRNTLFCIVTSLSIWFANTFLHSADFFTLLSCLLCRNFYIWYHTVCLFLLSLSVLLVSYQRNPCLFQSHESFPLIFSFRSFIVSGLKRRCFIHFELIFVYGVG